MLGQTGRQSQGCALLQMACEAPWPVLGVGVLGRGSEPERLAGVKNQADEEGGRTP